MAFRSLCATSLSHPALRRRARPSGVSTLAGAPRPFPVQPTCRRENRSGRSGIREPGAVGPAAAGPCGIRRRPGGGDSRRGCRAPPPAVVANRDESIRSPSRPRKRGTGESPASADDPRADYSRVATHAFRLPITHDRRFAARIPRYGVKPADAALGELRRAHFRVQKDVTLHSAVDLHFDAVNAVGVR